MSDIMEFGFDDAATIKNPGFDAFKQARAGEKTRISVISFKKHSDLIIAEKAREKKAPLSDSERAEVIAKVDAKLSEKLGKSLEELTEVDRLNINAPKFAFSYTHYIERGGVGTIRCLSTYQGSNVTKRELCCDAAGADAEQTVAMPVLVYPVDSEFQVDLDDLKKRKHTRVEIWKLSAKKYKKLEPVYKNARADDRTCIDLMVELDGDPKYQKQNVSLAGTATWAREDGDPEVRQWVLEQGLRAWKGVEDKLGFKMSKDKLMEKLGVQAAADSAASTAKLQPSYKDLLS
jgi:hypothetical protein